MSDPDAQTAIEERKAAVLDAILADTDALLITSNIRSKVDALIAAVEASKAREIEKLTNNLEEIIKAELAYRMNEQLRLLELSNLFTNGNAGTWEEVLHAAEALESSLASKDAEIAQLREALSALRIDANRLCDRQLGGSYEDDCRRSLKLAEAALAQMKGWQPIDTDALRAALRWFDSQAHASKGAPSINSVLQHERDHAIHRLTLVQTINLIDLYQRDSPPPPAAQRQEPPK